MPKEKLPKVVPVLCAVCSQPSAIITDLNGVLSQPVRLAKTMVKVAHETYVHEDPCLIHLKAQGGYQ